MYNYGKTIVCDILLKFVTSYPKVCLAAIHRRRLVCVNIDKCQQCHLLLCVLLLQMRIAGLAEMFSIVAADKKIYFNASNFK